MAIAARASGRPSPSPARVRSRCRVRVRLTSLAYGFNERDFFLRATLVRSHPRTVGLGKGIRTVGGSVAASSVLCGVAIAIPTLVPPLLVGLALWALRGYREVIQSLTLTWLVTFLNPALYEGQGALRWLVVGAAAASVLFASGQADHDKRCEPRVSVLPCCYFCLQSVLAGVRLAAFELVGFAAGAFVVLAVLVVEPRIEADWLSGWLAGLFWFVVLASAPLVGSGLGYVRNGHGFQGILNHPQSLGVFLAPFVAVFALDWLVGGRLPFAGLGALVGVVLLPMTEARVGVLLQRGASSSLSPSTGWAIAGRILSIVPGQFSWRNRGSGPGAGHDPRIRRGRPGLRDQGHR